MKHLEVLGQASREKEVEGGDGEVARKIGKRNQT